MPVTLPFWGPMGGNAFRAVQNFVLNNIQVGHVGFAKTRSSAQASRGVMARRPVSTKYAAEELPVRVVRAPELDTQRGTSRKGTQEQRASGEGALNRAT